MKKGIPTGRHEADEGHEKGRGNLDGINGMTKLTGGKRRGRVSKTDHSVNFVNSVKNHTHFPVSSAELAQEGLVGSRRPPGGGASNASGMQSDVRDGSRNRATPAFERPIPVAGAPSAARRSAATEEGRSATGSRGKGEVRRSRHPIARDGDRSPAATGVGPTPATTKAANASSSAILRVARKLDRRKTEAAPPRIDSFLDFLTHHARVKSGSGYVPYHFKGREALLPIVQQLDALLSSGAPDASLALCGGAQFGKTVLMLNLLAYLVAVRFRNVGYYLPDDDLVAGLVDGKLRPDVLDQIPWLARLLQVGKTLAPTGRAVNRKGAFLCTDGTRSALAFMRGLGKIPTSFSMDVVIQDEKDDLPEEHARFLSGRMTASDLRLSLIIGTQRYHGAGQNLAFTEGTQHIGLVRCPGCGKRWNPELEWPGICRLRVEKDEGGEADDNGVVGGPGRSQTEFGNEGSSGVGVASSAQPSTFSLLPSTFSPANAPRLTTEGHFVWGARQASVGSRRPQGDGASVVAGAVPSAGATNGSGTISRTALAFSERQEDIPVAALPPVLGTAPATTERLRPIGTSAATAEVMRKGAAREDEFPGGNEKESATRWPIPFTPGQEYYLACPDCGAELDRTHPEWHALAPDRAAQRRWSYRLSQLLFPDIDLAQIVAAWQLAIRDPAQMNVFCTDRLALPKSSSQTLTPHDLAAAREDYGLRECDQITGITQINQIGERTDDRTPAEFGNLGASRNLVLPSICYGGLDLGDQCWFVARAIESRAPHRARLLWVEPIAAERVRTRVPELFRALNLRALCVDAGPLRDLSRDLAFALNGLDEEATASGDEASRNIFFSRNGATLPLRWLASAERWENLRCVPVEFTQREGAGVRHKVARTQEGRVYPLLGAHRDESIARVITELTARGSDADGSILIENASGLTARAAGPRFLLPTPTESTRGVLDLYERHLLAGSRQERSADGRTLRFIDKCENHFLLATAYAALAELIAPVRDRAAAGRPVRPGFSSLGLPGSRMRARTERSVAG
jgi:hypothetical protein